VGCGITERIRSASVRSSSTVPEMQIEPLDGAGPQSRSIRRPNSPLPSLNSTVNSRAVAQVTIMAFAFLFEGGVLPRNSRLRSGVVRIFLDNDPLLMQTVNPARQQRLRRADHDD